MLLFLSHVVFLILDFLSFFVGFLFISRLGWLLCLVFGVVFCWLAACSVFGVVLLLGVCWFGFGFGGASPLSP